MRYLAIWICFLMLGSAGAAIASNCPEARKDVDAAIRMYGQKNKPYSEIVDRLETALRKCPDWSVPHRYLGVILQERGRLLEAIDHYQAAVDLDPLDFASCLYLGDVYHALGKDVHAVRYYFKGTRIIENDIDRLAANAETKAEYTKKREKLQEKTGFRDTVELTQNLNLEKQQRLGMIPKIDTAVEFDTDRAEIKPDWEAQLDAVAEVLRKTEMNPYRFVIQGHTDERGDLAHNDRLSMDRAQAVKSYLAGRGIPLGVLMTDGKGERRNISCDGESKEECWQKNRRVVFVTCKKGEGRD